MTQDQINAGKRAAYRIVWDRRETFAINTFEHCFLSHVLESIMKPEQWS